MTGSFAGHLTRPLSPDPHDELRGGVLAGPGTARPGGHPSEHTVRRPLFLPRSPFRRKDMADRTDPVAEQRTDPRPKRLQARIG
ncbi:hypothetical protein SAMN05216371_0804 [Streptomyces sp. TLI_053]|nr:hypothetical protein SAMN05216371_0804 [Streptomyces sp. TLI_053]